MGGVDSSQGQVFPSPASIPTEHQLGPTAVGHRQVLSGAW